MTRLASSFDVTRFALADARRFLDGLTGERMRMAPAVRWFSVEPCVTQKARRRHR
jgi:hypothetical protein